MPKGDLKFIKHNQIMTFEEICEFTKEAVGFGIDKIRLTGGEPLVRKGIADLVFMLNKIKGIKDLAMTTNGSLLSRYAFSLKEAGLNRINISLDTLNPVRYHHLTGTGIIDDVLDGINAAIKAGFYPIKINTVIEESPTEPDALQIAEFAKKKGLICRFIRRMDLREGKFWQVIGGSAGNCTICDRLRLSSDGHIRPCLFNDLQFSIKDLGINNALINAVEQKPEAGYLCKTTTLYGLGG
jgi:cyclic pyranopterin phosphate synthase